MDRKNTESLYTVNQLQYNGLEIHIYADSFKRADEWFAKCLRTGDVNFKQMEFDAEDNVRIDRIVDIKSEKPIYAIQGEEDPIRDKLTKGYDYESGCYVFSLVDVRTKTKQIQADTPDNALEIAGKTVFNAENSTEQGQNRQVYACSETDRVIVDGTVIKYCSEEKLTEKLRQEFPQGLTITLENESVQNLKHYKQVCEEGEWVAMRGIVNPDGMMAAAYGNLKAKLILKPEDYDMIYACENTYYSAELSDMGWDSGANATSILLASENSMRDIRIEVGVMGALDHLYIEGMPYQTVMELADKNKVDNDVDLIHCCNEEFLSTQELWKREMALKETKGTVNEFYVKKVAPAWKELLGMFHETQEQAAKENGYVTAAGWKREVRWTKNPSPEMADRLRRTAERWKDLYTPYEKEFNKMTRQMERLKVSEQRAFINQFNKMVSDVKVVQRGGDTFVRCRIGGVQQMAKPISKEVRDGIMDSKDPIKSKCEVAERIFAEEVVARLRMAKDRGMKI